jgi:LysM repeat protein
MMDEKMIESELENVSGGAAINGEFYTIQPGDTLSGIATKFRTTVSRLMALNPQIKNENLIYAGATLRIR